MERPAVVEYREDLLLTCTASGGPSNMFHWVKDGIDIAGSILNITEVTADDGGIYECVVSNMAGDSSVNITIYGRTYILFDQYTMYAYCVLFIYSCSTIYY